MSYVIKSVRVNLVDESAEQRVFFKIVDESAEQRFFFSQDCR